MRVEERIDYADKELAEWDKKNSGDKKKSGVSRFVVPVDSEGRTLEYGGLTRQQFREAAIQEEQDRAEGIDIERDRPEEGYDPSQYGDGVTDPV